MIARMIGTIGIMRRQPSRPKPVRPGARCGAGSSGRSRELGQLATVLAAKHFQALLEFVLV